eukprot:c18406_g1_i1 orf=18-218(-)
MIRPSFSCSYLWHFNSVALFCNHLLCHICLVKLMLFVQGNELNIGRICGNIKEQLNAKMLVYKVAQ